MTTPDIPKKRHLSAQERLWIAQQIYVLLPVARNEVSIESRWARHLISGAYLWYWTADGINRHGEVQRDLMKRDTDYLWHTDAALEEIRTNRKAKLTHEHAVPRTVLVERLLAAVDFSPEDIKAFLDEYCVGVVTLRCEGGKGTRLHAFKATMPAPWPSWENDRFARFEMRLNQPKFART